MSRAGCAWNGEESALANTNPNDAYLLYGNENGGRAPGTHLDVAAAPNWPASMHKKRRASLHPVQYPHHCRRRSSPKAAQQWTRRAQLVCPKVPHVLAAPAPRRPCAESTTSIVTHPDPGSAPDSLVDSPRLPPLVFPLRLCVHTLVRTCMDTALAAPVSGFMTLSSPLVALRTCGPETHVKRHTLTHTRRPRC